MNYIVKPPLEHTALVKIASILWNQHDIRTSVIDFANSPLFPRIDEELYLSIIRIGKRRENWQKIEDRVIDKASQLALRTSLKDKLMDYIQPVGFQILKWLEYHRRSCKLDLNLPKEFFWTSQGIIDKKKTAEVLIRDVSIPITTRYKLACIYCLEDDISDLFNEIPESDRESFYHEEDPSKVLQHKLVVFWTYTIKGKIDKIGREGLNQKCSPDRYAFRCAAFSANKIATEYFFQRLRNKELIVRTIFCALKKRHVAPYDPKCINPPREYYSEVLFFLFSQMNRDQQMEVFKKFPKDFMILGIFLDWPWQNFFVDTTILLCNLHKNEYYFILRMILHKIIYDYRGCNYEKIFEELWQKMPVIHKSYVINHSGIAGLVHMLLQMKDKTNRANIFKMIFQTATLMERKQLIFCDKGRYICEDLIEFDEWDLVKYFVQLCITSKDEMIKFKQEIEDQVQTGLSMVEEDLSTGMKDKYDKLSVILSNFICEYGKRKNEDEANSNSMKRLCNTE